MTLPPVVTRTEMEDVDGVLALLGEEAVDLIVQPLVTTRKVEDGISNGCSFTPPPTPHPEGLG